MVPAARLFVACVAATLVSVSTVARAQSADPPVALRLTPAESAQERELQLRLDDIESERAGVSTVVPWAVVAVGVAAIVVGVGVGVERVTSCGDESCSSPFWPAWMVVGGTGVSTAGLIWLRLAQEDIAELESRRYQLQQQLDAYDVLREARAQRALLHVRATF